MSDDFWFDVVTRITPDEPVDLDPVVFDHVADEVSREVAARGGYAADVVPFICGQLPFANIHAELVQALATLEQDLLAR